MRVNSLAFRLVAGAGLWIAAALAAGDFALSSIFQASVERGFDARLEVYLESLVAVSRADAAGKISLVRSLGDPRFLQPFSGWYWEIAGPQGPLLRSRSLWDTTLNATPPGVAVGVESGAPVTFRLTGPNGRTLRAAERDISLPGDPRRLRYLVAAEESEVALEVQHYDTVLAWSLAGLGLGLVLAVLIQVQFGLTPLRRMRGALAAIRDGQADRLEGDFPSEVQPLAQEVNELLEHNAVIVERARTHVGNLAHALKTPLAVLGNEAAREGGPLAESVGRQTDIMRRQVDHYLARARTAARTRVLGTGVAVLPVIEDLARTLERIHVERGIVFAVEGPVEATFRGERQDLEEMLGNLMDNGFKWAKSRVAVALERRGARLAVLVEDDGPGLAPEERQKLFQRGTRLDEAVPGSGLGLAIVRDIAELYGGSVSLAGSQLGGLSVTLILPAIDARP
ncbi:MAG TPA: sensor histidine kinase [Alphaproteobacteria bacterium]|nr:sensor histidine kinase [Alphaproteobacteria bacterium]